METTGGLPLYFDTLVFCVGSYRGAKKQTQEAPVDSWLGMDKERGQVDGQKA